MLRAEKLASGALKLAAPKLLGLVLAGGKSVRMGRDKALLKPWGEDGPTLVERAFALLQSVCGDCLVASGSGQAYAGLPCVADQGPAFGGPAYGVAAGLEYAAAHGFAGVLTLACDMPAMQAGPLRTLARAAGAAPWAWTVCFEPEQGGKLEMLAAVYRVEFLPALISGLAGGEVSLYWLAPAGRRLSVKYNAAEARHFSNCNTPEELEALLAEISGCRSLAR